MGKPDSLIALQVRTDGCKAGQVDLPGEAPSVPYEGAGKRLIEPQTPGWVVDPAARGITGEDLYVNFSGTYGSGD